MENLGDSRLSSKFQVTIPRRVRQHLNVDEGDLIVFLVDEKGTVILKKGEIRIKG